MTFKPAAINAEQNQRWVTARTGFLWEASMFSDVFYRLMNPKETEHVISWTKEVPIAATDGKNILANPDTFFDKKYTWRNHVFIVAHEVLHAIMDHPGQMLRWSKQGHVQLPSGKKLKFSADLMNIAMDLVINAILIDSKIGSFREGEWLYDPKIATAKDSVLDTYAKIYKQAKGTGGGGIGGGKSFDKLLPPGKGDGKNASKAAEERNEHEWQTAVAAGMATAKAQGKLPAGLEQLFGEVLEPKVDWTDKIAAFFSRTVGQDDYDWRKPDNRFMLRDIFVPSISGNGVGTVAVAVDTSGSIVSEPLTLDRFLAEVSGILEDVKPERLFLLWCDAAVHRVDECEDASDLNVIRAKSVGGGGGTDFRPVFDWLDDNDVQPDALVYLTDMMGDFPREAPNYPVLWGSIMKGLSAPFGEIVDVPVQEE